MPLISKDFLEIKYFFQESIPAFSSNINQKTVTANMKNKAPDSPVNPKTPIEINRMLKTS